jgi:hypothetical protein
MNKKNDIKYDAKNHNIYLIIILSVAIFYTREIIFSSSKEIPFGLDFDSNLSPITSMLKAPFSLWDDSWWLGFPNYSGSLSNIFYPLSTIPFMLFGIVGGLKVIIFIHFLLAGVGFYLFSQYLTKNNLVRLYGSIIFMLCGSLATKIYAGHLEKIMAFGWIPITLYFFCKVIENKKPRYIIYSSISASMFFMVGDLYSVIFFAFLFATFIIIRVVPTKDKVQVYNFLKIGILMILISAIKWFPIIFLKNYLVRNIDIYQGFESVFVVFSRFYSTTQEPTYGIWESYSYIGLIPFILAVIGIFHKSKEKWYLIASIIVGMIWVNNTYSLSHFIHMLPVLDNFRVPTRIYIFMTFYLIALSVLGFDYLFQKAKEKKIDSRALFCMFGIIIIVATWNVYTENKKFIQKEPDQSGIEIYSAITNASSSNLNLEPSLVTIGVDRKFKQHLFMQNGLHYFNAYYGYSFGVPDSMKIDGITYSIPNIMVIINTTKINNNSGYQKQLSAIPYNNSLSFAFLIKNNGGVQKLTVEKYRSGDVLINTSEAGIGDVVVLKSSYYIGWYVNKQTAENYNGLVSYRITEPTKELRFVYLPIDLLCGILVMLLSIPFSYFVIKTGSDTHIYGTFK